MEAVILHRARILAYSCPKQGQDFKPSAAPIYPNMGQVPPPVKHVYIAPDFMLTGIPLELLKDEESEFVFNTCSVSYITSSRELLREYVLNLVTRWTNELTVASLVNPTESHEKPHEPNDSNEVDKNRLESERKSQDKDNDIQKELVSNISNINKVERVACDTPGKPQEKFTISGKEDEWDSEKDRKVSLANLIAIGTDESPTEATKLAVQYFNMQANPQKRQRPLVKCSSTESDNTDCVIVCDPNFDLADITFNDQSFIQKLMNLWKPSSSGRIVHHLRHSRDEGNNIEEILALMRPELNVQLISGDDATVSAILRLKSPLVVHISSPMSARPSSVCVEGISGMTQNRLLFWQATTRMHPDDTMKSIFSLVQGCCLPWPCPD